jgi:hypothetical protein
LRTIYLGCLQTAIILITSWVATGVSHQSLARTLFKAQFLSCSFTHPQYNQPKTIYPILSPFLSLFLLYPSPGMPISCLSSPIYLSRISSCSIFFFYDKHKEWLLNSELPEQFMTFFGINIVLQVPWPTGVYRWHLPTSPLLFNWLFPRLQQNRFNSGLLDSSVLWHLFLALWFQECLLREVIKVSKFPSSPRPDLLFLPHISESFPWHTHHQSLGPFHPPPPPQLYKTQPLVSSPIGLSHWPQKCKAVKGTHRSYQDWNPGSVWHRANYVSFWHSDSYKREK